MQKKRILCTSAALLAAISLIMPNQGYAKAKKPVLSKKKLTMSVGESKTLKVKNTKKKVKWSSGKKSVASVSKKGRVKAKKKGTAVITAKVAKTKLNAGLRLKQRRQRRIRCRIRNRVIHQTIHQTRICRIKRKACRLHRFGF